MQEKSGNLKFGHFVVQLKSELSLDTCSIRIYQSNRHTWFALISFIAETYDVCILLIIRLSVVKDLKTVFELCPIHSFISDDCV